MKATCTAIACVFLSFAGESRAELLPAGPEFSVPSENVVRGAPSVDHFANGSVLAVWFEMPGGTDLPIKARIYDANGLPTGPEFALGITHQNTGIFVRVVPPGDRFVVLRSDGVPSTPVWRLYDGNGAPLGAEVTVSVAGNASAKGLAVDANGNVAILYSEDGASNRQLKLQRYTTAGLAVGTPTVVAEFTSGELDGPFFGLEAASDGNLVVGWAHNTAGPGDGSPTGWVRRYDTSGAAVGTDFAFSGPHDDGWLYGQLETDGAGHIYTAISFIAGPTSSEENSSPLTRFSLDGSDAVQYSFEEPNPTSILSRVIRATPDGRLVVAWNGWSYDGYYSPHGWIVQYAPDGTRDGPPVPLFDRLYGASYVSGLSVNSNGSAFVACTTTEIGMGNPDAIDAKLQRYCDTDDASCALCPAFDDNVDTDGDRIPDGCDPCSNVAGAQDAVVSKTSVAGGFEPRDRRIAFDESFVLPPGTSFGDLTVLTDGARLRVQSVRGQAMFDAVLPGGAYTGSGTRGWTATATKLKYSDRTDSPIDGVKRALIVDQSNKEPGRVRVKARAGGGEYSSWESYLPMTAIAVLGNETSAAAGVCGEFQYVAEQCEPISYTANRCIGVAE